MSTNRLMMLFVVVALILVTALTVREALATATVISQSGSARRTAVECASLPSRQSLHNKYVQGLDAWVTYSEDGPTGVDGGLIELMSSYRTCSQ